MSNVQLQLAAYMRPVLREAAKDFQLFQEKLGDRMSSKLQSEIISLLVQKAAERVIPDARCGHGDKEADLYLSGTPVELKTSLRSNTWRGGEYSKRSGDFLLLSWDVTATGLPMWCLVHASLSEDDWRSSGSANYYATTISLDEALRKNGQVLVGTVRKARKLTHPVYETA